MSGKRNLSDCKMGSQTKKSKTDWNNCLHKCFKESGLTLKHPPEKCVASQETVLITRNFKKTLEKHFDYPRNVSELFSNFEKECQDIDIFKHYLFPNIVLISEDILEERPLNDSVIKILLSVPILQHKMIDYIFEKSTDLATQSSCGQWIQMILKNFSTLDSIVDSDKIATNLINLLDITTEKMVRLEIITAIPDIIGDEEHNNVATEMSRILNTDQDLIPAILDCLTYLCLSDDQYEQLQKTTLNILASMSKCHYFPNFVKFLLIPGRLSDNAYLEAAQGLRNALKWSTSMSSPQEIASSQVLTFRAIRSSMISSKVTSNAWFKVISMCKLHTDHKPIDFIILLILFSTSEDKQRQVENLIKKQIKLNILTEDLLDKAFEKFKPILEDSLRNLIVLTNTLLKMKGDSAVTSFASHIYTLMFSTLKDSSQTIVAELLQLGLDSKQCVMTILNILNNVALQNVALLIPQSVQMLTLLERMDDDMPLTEVRAVMNLLCGLAYSYENSLIRDDIHMIIRKELSSSNPTIKIQGILAGVHAVKYLMATNTNDETKDTPNDASQSSVSDLIEGDVQEAAQIIELISRSTRQFPDMIAFFYDELTKIIASATFINKHFQSWLTNAVTNDLQQNFIVDNIENERVADLSLLMQYCLNADSEMDEIFAINIAGLTLQSKSEISISILSPLFQLVQTLHSKEDEGNLSSIDALLGCPVVIPKFNIDEIEDMDPATISHILDCLIHTVNWFRELLNAFALQEDDVLKAKTLTRVRQIDELQIIIAEILMKTKISYKPPVCTFNINKYKGETTERMLNRAQSSKEKQQKKTAQDDTVLPETLRSQAVQNITVKSDVCQNIPFRRLNLNLIYMLNTNLSTDDESELNLNIRTFKFLLQCVSSNLEDILISKIKKQTFLTKQNNNVYDPKKAEDCAKSFCKILPKLMKHLQFVTLFLDNHCSATSQNESGFLYTSEMLQYLTCLEYIYQMLTIYFKWMGLRNNNALLKTSLRTIANSDSAIISLKDLLTAVAEQLKKHQKFCLQLSTAVSLIELVKSIHSYSDSSYILKILKNMAEHFLKQEWRTADGALEKGLFFNQSVDSLVSIYIINNELLELKNFTFQLIDHIKPLKSRNDTLISLKCINKGNFPILYRNIGTSLSEAIKTEQNKGMTNSRHLQLWKDVATILKYMSDIAKALDNRNNLTAFFKRSLPVLKSFLSQGIPILEIQFKNQTQDVIEILKILQQSTRFLQSLCCHSRLKKDKALMSKVPLVRQLLETLIYRVKALLAANNCSEAFWMGNLKNKNIHGEVIATQASVDQESVEDCDEQLPEDDDSDNTDDENINPESRSLSDIV